MEWFVWSIKEIDTLYDVINFEATCFFNQKEPEDHKAFEIPQHWDLKAKSVAVNGKIVGMQERGQFDALSQVLEIYNESRGTDETLD